MKCDKVLAKMLLAIFWVTRTLGAPEVFGVYNHIHQYNLFCLQTMLTEGLQKLVEIFNKGGVP